MSEQTMIKTPTEGATPSVAPSTHRGPKMTKDELQQKSDAELLKMIRDAQGHTKDDFPEYMNTEFSYSFLTNLMKERGFESGWHKTSEGTSPVIKPDVILMKQPKGKSTTRKSFIIDNDISEEWKAFNRNIPFPSVTLGYALRRFISDYHSGRIKFELEI